MRKRGSNEIARSPDLIQTPPCKTPLINSQDGKRSRDKRFGVGVGSGVQSLGGVERSREVTTPTRSGFLSHSLLELLGFADMESRGVVWCVVGEGRDRDDLCH